MKQLLSRDTLFLLDNGHGINTPGKRSPEWADMPQLLEYEFAREIVSRLMTWGSAFNINFVNLVPEAMDISLNERAKRANELFLEFGNCVLISIHGNAADAESARGWEVHTYLGKSLSDDIADVFWEQAKILMAPVTKMRGDESDGDHDWDSNFAILRQTKCPAILTENLFYTNKADCSYMLSDEGKDVIALIHLNGCLACMGEQTFTYAELLNVITPEDQEIEMPRDPYNVDKFMVNKGLFF